MNCYASAHVFLGEMEPRVPLTDSEESRVIGLQYALEGLEALTIHIRLVEDGKDPRWSEGEHRIIMFRLDRVQGKWIREGV